MVNWDSPKVLRLLGTMSDRSLAIKLGTSISAVRWHREKNKIPAFNLRVFIPTKEHLRYLGKVPDPVFSEKFKISLPTVIRARKEIGLPCVRTREALELGEVEPDWTPCIIEMLRTATDQEIANLFDVSVEKITAIREKNEIKIGRE